MKYKLLTRKLSTLQRWILIHAAQALPELETRAAEQDKRSRELAAMTGGDYPYKEVKASDVAHLSRLEILSGYFKLPRRGKWNIDIEATDYATYNSANASMYRAVRRLKERGLLVKGYRNNWIQLTSIGIEVAQELAKSR